MAYGFKTGGRQKGTPNKNTEPVCENLRNIFMDEFESGRVQEALQQLEPKDYIAAILKLSPYVFAKARPADSAAEPHAPDEPAAETAEALEEPQPEKEESPYDAVQQNIRERLVGGEIERFRQHMNWTEEQVQRFIAGGDIGDIDSN